MCQGSDSDSEDAVSAVEKNDEAVTDVTTATSASEAATEKPKVKYWPRPVQTSSVRNGNRKLPDYPSKKVYGIQKLETYN